MLVDFGDDLAPAGLVGSGRDDYALSFFLREVSEHCRHFLGARDGRSDGRHAKLCCEPRQLFVIARPGLGPCVEQETEPPQLRRYLTQELQTLVDERSRDMRHPGDIAAGL